MFIDYENLYSGSLDAAGDLVQQDITATAASANVIDHGQAGYGEGEAVDIVVQVTEDFNNLTSLTIDLQTDDAAAFSSPAVVNSLGAIPLASLVAGAMFRMKLDNWSLEQFSRLNFTVTGTNPTTGGVIAYAQLADQGIQSNIAGRMDQYGQL